MKTADRRSEHTGIDWLAVAGVQPVVYVAKAAGQPIAILELKPGVGFQLTAQNGELVGNFATRAEGEAALEAWLEGQA